MNNPLYSDRKPLHHQKAILSKEERNMKIYEKVLNDVVRDIQDNGDDDSPLKQEYVNILKKAGFYNENEWPRPSKDIKNDS